MIIIIGLIDRLIEVLLSSTVNNLFLNQGLMNGMVRKSYLGATFRTALIYVLFSIRLRPVALGTICVNSHNILNLTLNLYRNVTATSEAQRIE